ncbi:hypothetical protein Dsin_001676 [Dipteronia sinensis]|uniref:Reverse transcriptase domain-containing protein n=1 Tax=Dipteronia sinensis TaxID=43782 RepID=A0AAE0EKI5_9ROSI|nr:hypothetical protein Dsin_001676 [Dipteronia sinensis]
MRNYHKDVGYSKLALKVDLMKAFNMVDWGFSLEALAPFHFPPKLTNLFGYTIGSLPIRYLGIPIISSRLCPRDCSPLVDKVSTRLTSWLNRGLSYTYRLQLIVSVLTSLQVFGLVIFTSVIKSRKLLSRNSEIFLWKGIEGDSKGAKIYWSDICLPNKEGGLSIKDLSSWNKALMIRHLWILIYGTNNLWSSWNNALMIRHLWMLIYGTNNLWSSWIKAYHLKDSNL